MKGNNKINKNVAVIEYSESHAETMHTQIQALKRHGYNVFLVCTPPTLPCFNDKSLFSEILVLHGNIRGTNTSSAKIKDIKQLRKFTRKHNINTVIFNTVEMVRNLVILPLPRVKNYIGIAHTNKYISGSSSFKWISRRIKKVFFLSENMLQYTKKPSRPIELDYFLPIHFEKYDNVNISKGDDEFWYCSPGAANDITRDLVLFVEQIKKANLPKNVKIIILGKLDKDLHKTFDELNCKNIVYFKVEERLPQDVFNGYLQKADAILPLIHSQNIDGFYGNHRISGSFNIAYGYRIPLIMEKAVAEGSIDFKNVSLTYELDNIAERIKEIAEKPKEYEYCLDYCQKHPNYNLETQAKRFIEFVEKNYITE